MAAVLYWKELKYYGIIAGVLTFAFIGIVKGPVYKILNVQPHYQVSAEMLGLL